MKRGFTLTEAIVVIAVIVILVTISAFGVFRLQAEGRDAQRASAAAVIAETLERYYDRSGEYPSCLAVEAAPDVVAVDTLKGIDASVLRTPQAPTTELNSIECTDNPTLTVSGPDFYEYTGDGSAACSGSVACLNFTLKYKNEVAGEIKEIKSRRDTSIATSGAPTLSSSGISFDQATLSWTQVQNATSYTLQRADNALFEEAIQDYSTSSLSQTVGGLTPGRNYYFRVKPGQGSDSGTWSNTVIVSTLGLAAPAINATTNSSSQVTVSWGIITNATSYTIRYSTSSMMTSPTEISGITSLSNPVTGLSAGTTYYFQAQAVNGTYTSEWSDTVSATTTIPVPTGLTATTASATQINTSWNAVSVATSYTLQYDTTSTFSAPSTITGIVNPNRSVTGLTQGERYYFRVYALVGAATSGASNTATAVTTVNAPTGASLSVSRPCCSVKYYADSDWIPGQSFDEGPGNYYYAYGTVSGGSCAIGTTRQIYMQATYNSPVSYYTTPWSTTSTWYMISPWNGYSVIFDAYIRCAGSDANSAQVYVGQGAVAW